MTEGMYGIMDSCSREKLLMMAANKWKISASEDKIHFCHSTYAQILYLLRIKIGSQEIRYRMKEHLLQEHSAYNHDKA